MPQLMGQRIVLTGVSRGVGLEVTRLFLQEGAQVLGVARDAARLARVREVLGADEKQLGLLSADVVAADSAARIAQAVEARWGAFDVLFNNAGVQLDGAAIGFQELAASALYASFDVNLFAPYRLCLGLLPLLLRGNAPRIVNVSSGAGNFESMRSPNIASYRLSKWALNGFTMLLAAELQGKVSVNAFDPGWVKTDMGGPGAPGLPQESAIGALALLQLPARETGKFWKDGKEIPF